MINFALAREIYGGSPWMIDPISFSGLFGILKDFRNGVKLEHDTDNKLNSSFVLNIESKHKTVFSKWQLDDDDSEVIAVHKIDGVITKGGGDSSFGTKDIASRMSIMTKDRRIKGHVLLSDSGGGSSNAVVFMKDAIREAQNAGKPVVQLIEKGGLSASAMLYIGSFSDFIFSETEDNLVGSIGTMIEMSGMPKNHTDTDGVVHVRAYATASVHKNEEFEQAMKGNMKPIINNILDPHNEKFMQDIRNNRPNVLESQLSGKMFKAGEVVGTLIDAIGNMDDAVNKVIELSSNGSGLGVGDISSDGNNVSSAATTTNKNKKVAQVPNNNSNLNNQKMDLNKLKSEHPSVYNEVFALGQVSGAKSEKDRAGSWMAHSKTDLVAVKAGIASGEPISDTQREEFLVKNASLSHLENLKSDSSKTIKTASTKTETEPTADEKELKAHEAKLDAKLNFKTA